MQIPFEATPEQLVMVGKVKAYLMERGATLPDYLDPEANEPIRFEDGSRTVGQAAVQFNWHNKDGRQCRGWISPGGKVAKTEIWVDVVPYDPEAEEDESEGYWAGQRLLAQELNKL